MSVEHSDTARHHRLKRMVGRDPREASRASSPLELLFDLTFVVAFSQGGDRFSHLMAEGHIAPAVIGFVTVVFAVCWAWLSYTWFASAFDTDDWLHRLLTMVQMVGVVILALGIPDIFDSLDHNQPLDFRVVAGGYIVMRISMVAMWMRVARNDPANRRTALLYVFFTAAAQLGWVTVALLRIDNLLTVLSLIAVLWMIELAGPVIANWDSNARGEDFHGTPWHAHHIAERYGLFVIITLGEGILGTIAAVSALVSHVGWSGEAVLVAVAGVGLTFGLWWSYFIIPSAEVLDRHRNRKWSWSYGHIALFGALAAVGGGIHLAAYAVEGVSKIGTVGVVFAVAIPVFIYGIVYFVLYSVLFRAVDSFHVRLAAIMVAFLVLAVVLAANGAPLVWCLLVVMASPAVLAVGFETVGYRHIEADVQREGG